MAWLLLGVALLGGFLLILRWYVSAEPKTLVRTLRWGGLAVGVVVALFLMVTGRFGLLWMAAAFLLPWIMRSEEHTSELQSLMRISYAVFCLKKKNISRKQ